MVPLRLLLSFSNSATISVKAFTADQTPTILVHALLNSLNSPITTATGIAVCDHGSSEPTSPMPYTYFTAPHEQAQEYPWHLAKMRNPFNSDLIRSLSHPLCLSRFTASTTSLASILLSLEHLRPMVSNQLGQEIKAPDEQVIMQVQTIDGSISNENLMMPLMMNLKKNDRQNVSQQDDEWIAGNGGIWFDDGSLDGSDSVSDAGTIRTDYCYWSFVNQTLRSYYESVGISHETSVARTPQQNGIVESRLRIVTPKIDPFTSPPWNINSYELLHDIKPDYSYLHILLCTFAIQTHVSRTNWEKFKLAVKAFSLLTAMASEQSSLEPVLHEMTHATPSSGLIPNPPPSAPFVPSLRHEWDIVFQPGFDEFFSPPASVASPVPAEEASAPVESTGLPSSTTVDQDAPSPKESHDLEVAHMSNDPYILIPIPKTIFEESSSSDVITTTVHSDAPVSEHLGKWTKDHPLQNIIGVPSRPVSTRLQLYKQALFCYYGAFLTSIKPKTYKDALT
ncbi:retrovirus-related pol polyprotein from transposon TNT 1-94 [Tanacetum coccineum]